MYYYYSLKSMNISLPIHKYICKISQGGSYTFELVLALPQTHSPLHAHHPLAKRSLGGPESIMSCMMFSGLPQLVGDLHFFQMSLCGPESIMPHDAFRSTATYKGSSHFSSSSFKESRWARKHHVLHDAFWSTTICVGSSSSLFFNLHLQSN